ncbi:thioredoxin family protein [Sulfurimonas sp.]|uniref:thioredoxin family protein n=1 Tax=Sulfurimonas sp. TaxID=2022749 RepID=UPI0026351EED|nr:thioredoxin family protein [Sulfurimonas sp.]
MKTIVLLMGILFSISLNAEEAMLQETPFTEVLSQVTKHKMTFIEVGSDSCHSCQIMGRKLYKIKQQHPEYPIYFVNVHKERNAAYRLRVQMIPTQIILDNKGYEIYRHVGILPTKEIHTLFQQKLKIDKI